METEVRGRGKRKITPETALKARIKKLLATFRIWTFPVLQGMGAHPGIADRLGIWENGCCPHCGGQVSRPLALEIKSPKGKLTDNQRAFQEHWSQRGGLYVPVWQEEDVIEALKLPVKTLF